MKDYYSRQIMLWGEEAQKSLSNKSILIVGSGGLGCSVALALSGVGLGEIDIVDFDRVEIHNIHRQILFDTKDIGRLKAEVVSNKIARRDSNLKSKSYTMPFNEFIKESPRYDLIIDATDNLETREEIDNYAKELNIAWIYGSVEEFNGQVCLFKDSSFSIFNKKDVKQKGISAPMVMQVASFEANLALRFLLNLPIKSDILHYLYYNSEGDFEIKKFKLGD